MRFLIGLIIIISCSCDSTINVEFAKVISGISQQKLESFDFRRVQGVDVVLLEKIEDNVLYEFQYNNDGSIYSQSWTILDTGQIINVDQVEILLKRYKMLALNEISLDQRFMITSDKYSGVYICNVDNQERIRIEYLQLQD